MIRCHKVWSGIAHRATAAHHAHRAPPHHVGIRHAHHVARHTVAITVCKYVAGAVVAGGALAGGAAIGGLPGLSGAPAAYVPIRWDGPPFAPGGAASFAGGAPGHPAGGVAVGWPAGGEHRHRHPGHHPGHHHGQDVPEPACSTR